MPFFLSHRLRPKYLVKSHIFRLLSSSPCKNEVILNISVKKLCEGCAQEKQKLEHSLTGIGFFYITECGVDQQLVDDVRSIAHQMFSLDEKVKNELHMKKSTNFRGWSRVNEEVTKGKPDHKETFDFGVSREPILPSSMKNYKTYHSLDGPNMWPPKDFEWHQERVDNYMQVMNEVGLIVMKSCCEILDKDFNKLHSTYFDKPFSLMRFIRYPPAGGEELGVGEHADYGFLTMILQDPDAGGLEAKSLSGEWHPVPTLRKTFTVNIGEMMEAWSGGRFRATPHRVIHKAVSDNTDRISVPFFFEPSLDSRVKAPSSALSRDGADPLAIYGDHIYRAYAESYPTIRPKPKV